MHLNNRGQMADGFNDTLSNIVITMASTHSTRMSAKPDVIVIDRYVVLWWLALAI